MKSSLSRGLERLGQGERLSHIAILAIIAALSTGCDSLKSLVSEKHPCADIRNKTAQNICMLRYKNGGRPLIYADGQGEVRINGLDKNFKNDFDAVSSECGSISINGDYHSNPCKKESISNKDTGSDINSKEQVQDIPDIGNSN